ncbi:MAG: hypothetical protein WC676_06485 [Candidatus Omnitrophota bacterium]
MKKYQALHILLITIGLCLSFSGLHTVIAGEEKTTAYQLALLHTKALFPEEAMMNPSLRPENAVITEFQWLLDSLSTRCINSQPEIVSIIISAWKLVRSRHYDISLLDATRGLTRNALNKSKFGNTKVDFQKTSGMWTSQYKPKK